MKEECNELERYCAELKQKYSEVPASFDNMNVKRYSGFVSRLSTTVATLNERKTFPNITIRLCDKTIPADKFNRPEVWHDEILADIYKLGMKIYND